MTMNTSRHILQRMLTNWEMRPTVVSGGIEALEALGVAAHSKNPIRLMLLDLMMPRMDGLEVARRVQEQFGMVAPKILILSSAGHLIGKKETVDLGVERILTKPVKQSDLLDAITRLFGAATRDDGDPLGPPPRLPDPVAQMRVLLVEDGRVNQLVAIKLLEDRGHSVAVASNGREGLELFARSPFDAILMDLQMPEMDGFEATRRIREEEAASGTHTPIIAMTANAMRGDREKCLDAGMDDYVAKPVRSAELFSTVEKFARSAAPAAAGSGRTDGLEVPSANPDSGRVGSPFDREAFRGNCGDEDLMRRLTDAFVEEAAEFLAAAKKAIEEGETETLRRAAHSLKGLVGIYFADRALLAAKDLESAHASGPGKAGKALEECEGECARLGEALRSFVDTLKG